MSDKELVKRLRSYAKDQGGWHNIDDTCEEAAARIEALTEQLEAARADAKEAEAYAEELEKERDKTYQALLKVTKIHDEVETKLAKAVEALGAIKLYSGCGDSRRQAIETLAELKGEDRG